MNRNVNIEVPKIMLENWGSAMKVKTLDIKGIGGVRKLSLKFNEGLNVICGANGIGKTTILNVIADAFSLGGRRIVKRNALFAEGEYSLCISTENETDEIKKNVIKDFFPDELTTNNAVVDGEYLMNFGINRNFPYDKLVAIPRDPSREFYDIAGMAINGIEAKDIKGWFVNRSLFSTHQNSLPDQYIQNYGLSKNVFGLLDKTVSFKSIDSATLDIVLETSNGDVYFEYLSSGYKTCIYIILGIIKEIEFRFKKKPLCASQFDGVVLIDEIDMHLHPTWQAELIQALKTIFPKIQLIVTTHSPSILQSLEKDEIIALGLDEDGNTFVKELDLGEYGLQGWTLEEILHDVMGMPSTTSELYKNTIEKFDKAMDDENGIKIMEQYKILIKMLHPKNPLQKLLKLQVAEWEE